MSVSNLTRFPGKSVPKEIITGNPVLDSFIMELDGYLFGSAKVRMQYLAEIKDHVLEKKGRLIAEGYTEGVAMENAVQSMGTPDELAKSHRGELKKKFLRIALPTGLLFGLFMVFFNAFTQLKGKGIVPIGLSGLLQGVFFGIFMGWFMTFIWPERQLYSVPKSDCETEAESEFVVYYSEWVRRLSYPLTVLFLLGGIYFVSFGIAGFFYPWVHKSLLYDKWISVFLGGLSIIDFFFVRLGCRKYKVNEDGIYVYEFLGMKKFFAWANLKKVGLLGDIKPWPLYWKKVKYAEFGNGHFKTRRVFIYPDMINADRLFVLLYKKATM